MDDPAITDDQMRERLLATKPYTLIILHKTALMNGPGAESVVWEHGRRNFQLLARGVLAIVCPVRDATDVAGLCIFTTNTEETRRLMEDDPGVKAGLFTYETHSTRSFPGSALP